MTLSILQRKQRRREIGGAQPRLYFEGLNAVRASHEFETELGSIKDEVRRQPLRHYTPIFGPFGWTNFGFVVRQATAFVLGRRLPRLDRRRVLALVRKLDPDADSNPTTLPSKLCTVTFVKPAWVCTPVQLPAVETLEVRS